MSKIPSDSLKVKKLQKIYKKRVVIDNISLFVCKGKSVGLLGPNGAGKTTCFTIIAGLISPTKGSIFLNGKDITNLPIYRRGRLGIGYLPQEPSIFRGLNVEENIRAILEISEKNLNLREEKLEKLLNDFNIKDIRHSLSNTLSGGERRRVEIARALAANPSYMMLDEPLAGIDPIAISDIRDIISKLQELNIGVLITDHNVRETLAIVDRVYIISNGKILTEGSPCDIVKNKNVKEVYLGNNFNY